MKNETLSLEQAYKAMYLYLENLYKMTDSDDIGSFLGGMSFIEEDRSTADPAAWEDWIEAVKKSLEENNNDEYYRLDLKSD